MKSRGAISSTDPTRAQRLAPPLEQVERTWVLFRGRKFSYFGGCDYFRLSTHPDIVSALNTATPRYGVNVAASRLTTGNHPLYEELEAATARFFDVPAATLVASGYVANLAAAEALAGGFSHAIIDERAHCSLKDAARRLGCPVLAFAHRNVADFERVLRQSRAGRPVVLTDGMFSHDGRLAPLEGYLQRLGRGATLLVDEAHGAGALGSLGRGTLEVLGIQDARVVRTITFSKAFGVYGGAILGSRALQGQVHARSPVFAGQTPLPPPLAQAVLRALELVRSDRSLRSRLEANTAFVKDALRERGLSVPANPSPIVHYVPRSRTETSRIQALLLRRRIYPSLVRYPGGPRGGYFRFALSSEHSQGQLDDLVRAFRDFLPDGTS